MEKRITAMLGTLVLSILFIGSYLDARIRGGRGRVGGYHRRYPQYRYRRPGGWHHNHYNGWGWWGWPSFWLTIPLTSSSDASDRDAVIVALKAKINTAITEINEYSFELNTLKIDVQQLKNNISLFSNAAIHKKIADTNKIIDEYNTQIWIVTIKVEQLKNTTSNLLTMGLSQKDIEKKLNETVNTVNNHTSDIDLFQEEIQTLKNEIYPLATSLMQPEKPISKILDETITIITRQTNEMKNFNNEINKLK